MTRFNEYMNEELVPPSKKPDSALLTLQNLGHATGKWDEESQNILTKMLVRMDLSGILDFLPINREKFLDAVDDAIAKKFKIPKMRDLLYNSKYMGNPRFKEFQTIHKDKNNQWAAAMNLVRTPKSLARFTKYDAKYLG